MRLRVDAAQGAHPCEVREPALSKRVLADDRSVAEEAQGEEEGRLMASDLKCEVCGRLATLFAPLVYHSNRLHCNTQACSVGCGDCRDDEDAVVSGASVANAAPASSPTPEKATDTVSAGTSAPPPPSSSYAEMMARLKGGAK